MFSQYWKVLVLFIIPIGGGIPAGVLLAKNQGITWQITTILYFISDLILACAFEPLLLLFIATAKRVQFLDRLGIAMKERMKKITAHYGTGLGPFALVMISFGVDPMTGRTAAIAAGHGFFTGWLIAIAGDMIFFGILMVSTLLLNNILGDGTWTTLIILTLMMIVPTFFRRLRKRYSAKT